MVYEILKKNIIFLCILRQLFGHSERRRWLIWIVPAQNHSLRVVLFIRRLSYCAHFRLSHVTPVLSFKRPYVYTFERPFVPFHRCFVFTPLTIRRHLAKFFPPLRSTQINCETFYFYFISRIRLHVFGVDAHVPQSPISFESKMLRSISSRFFNLAAAATTTNLAGVHSSLTHCQWKLCVGGRTRTCWMYSGGEAEVLSHGETRFVWCNVIIHST